MRGTNRKLRVVELLFIQVLQQEGKKRMEWLKTLGGGKPMRKE